jgi:hypothetical protein
VEREPAIRKTSCSVLIDGTSNPFSGSPKTAIKRIYFRFLI